MSGIGGVLKDGWHPKGKDGKSPESWRGDFKGVNQVAGWMGKGKETNSGDTSKDHISRPLSTLKDPASFGPPPKNVNYHGGAALPNKITPDRGGLGAPLNAQQIKAKREREELRLRQEEERAALAAAPPLPFRSDTTGLSTSHLPPPPRSQIHSEAPTISTSSKPKPSLPPRLPPRQGPLRSEGVSTTPPPSDFSKGEPSAHRGILNQASLNRLGSSGISVLGFGIGKQIPPSPPLASKPPISNESRVTAVQARVSQMALSNPAAPLSNQGTTLAQKQAALKTVTSFRNDPSSVSLTDAKEAVSTANNFRERHGDQVVAGWKSANSLNQKYGIVNKVERYAGSPQSSHTLAPNPESTRADNVGPSKRPPPPPPKKSVLSTGPSAVDTSSPPPLPFASKPQRQKPQNSQQNDLDLDLGSLWFAKTPIIFPPKSIASLPGTRGYTYTSSWSSSDVRRTYTFTGAIRHHSNLATTKIHLTWDGSNPGYTVKAEQKHQPPPSPPNARELENYQAKYSNVLANWCENQMGTQVGNGECWTLAADGLAVVASLCHAEGLEPCMRSQGVVHGYPVFTFLPPQPTQPPGGIEAAGVCRGDIIQFLSCHFKRKDGRGQSWAGAPDHTSVVTGVERGGVLSVVEQNVGGVKKVQKGSYNFSELVSGEVRIFRAVRETWAGKLEASWP